MKDIEKLLKQAAKDVLPDDGVKKDIIYKLGIEENEKEVELGGIRAKLAGHKKVVAACACGLAAVIAVCAFIPLMLKSGNKLVPPSHPGQIQISASEEVYGFSAATAGMIISGAGASAGTMSATAMTAGTMSASTTTAVTKAATTMSAGKSLGALAQGYTNSGRDQIDDEQTIATINGYMNLVESLISGQNFTVAAYENTTGEYLYKYMMTTSYTDVLGVTHDGGTIHYNRTHEETEYDDGETETEYRIEGIMVLDGVEYPIHGESKSESDGGESEEEYELYVEMGKSSYILVEQSLENEDGESEIEYSYTVYENGKRVSRTTFEYEQEGNETELLMTTDEGNGQQIFAFEREGNEIVIRIGGVNGQEAYIVRIIDGQYVYYRGDKEIDREHRH